MYDDIDRIRDLDGEIYESESDNFDPHEPVTCPRCYGEGLLIDGSNCPFCGATGEYVPWETPAF